MSGGLGFQPVAPGFGQRAEIKLGWNTHRPGWLTPPISAKVAVTSVFGCPLGGLCLV
jgi:hypothetical protein